MKDITTEEAIKILKNVRKLYDDLDFINSATKKCNESKAIEKVLNELNDYKEGKIVSLKLLEKFNLISRDEKNQHSFANEDFFEKYVPKDIIKKKDKIINAMAEEIEKFGCISTEVFDSAKECMNMQNCIDCIKQYFERKVENE